jgi:hypothetical protein
VLCLTVYNSNHVFAHQGKQEDDQLGEEA